MYVLIAGGGKAGANVMRTLLRNGHEATLIEQDRDRFEVLEQEFEHQAMLGDATEIYVLEKAGIRRPPDLVLALTGDDEDNMVICQLAKEKYGVQKVIARVNDPRNQAHFDLLGISPTVCATSSILGLVEHEVPEHELVHLLELRKENLEAGLTPIVARLRRDHGSTSLGRRERSLAIQGFAWTLRGVHTQLDLVANDSGNIEAAVRHAKQADRYLDKGATYLRSAGRVFGRRIGKLSGH